MNIENINGVVFKKDIKPDQVVEVFEQSNNDESISGYYLITKINKVNYFEVGTMEFLTVDIEGLDVSEIYSNNGGLTQ